jgi:glycosyltransferase involved in cell wall biosynthesis
VEVVVSTETRFATDDRGQPVCADGTYGYAFWRRYLDVFDRVILVARRDSTSTRRGYPVVGEGIQFWPLDDSRGTVGALHRWRKWRHQVKPLLRTGRAFVLRLPGQVGGMLGNCLDHRGLPYAVEVVGDPATVFARGAYRSLLRPCLQRFFVSLFKSQCSRAVAAAYVTERYLQRRYPASDGALVTAYSSIELADEAFALQPRQYAICPPATRLVSVGTMSQPYKGQHVLIDALASRPLLDWPWQLTLVGDGARRSALELQVRRNGLAARVQFMGQVAAGSDVRQLLDQADLFVLPSLTEGLPRALIEAQARALPCLASDVGGVCELLDSGERVPPGQPAELARAIASLMNDGMRLTRLSRENLQKSRQFEAHRLQCRRRAFYAYVKRSTESLGHSVRRAA